MDESTNGAPAIASSALTFVLTATASLYFNHHTTSHHSVTISPCNTIHRTNTIPTACMQGLDLNAVSSLGITVFHFAAMRDSIEV